MNWLTYLLKYFVLLKIKVDNWQIRTSSVLIAFHFSLLSSSSVTVPCGRSSWLPSPQSQTFTAWTLYHIVSFNRHCVRWGSSSPTKRGTAVSPRCDIAWSPSWHLHWTKTKTKTFLPTLLWHGRPSQQLMSSCSVTILGGRSSYTFPQTFTIWHGRCIMSYIDKHRRRHLKWMNVVPM